MIILIYQGFPTYGCVRSHGSSLLCSRPFAKGSASENDGKALFCRCFGAFAAVQTLQNHDTVIMHDGVFLCISLCSGEETGVVTAGLLHIFGILVDVGIHGHGDFGMARDALQGLDIHMTGSLQLGE